MDESKQDITGIVETRQGCQITCTEGCTIARTEREGIGEED